MAIDLQVEFLEKSLPQDNFSFHLWIWGKHLSHSFDAGTNYGAGKFCEFLFDKNEILHPLKLIWKLCLQMSFWLSRWQMFFDQVVPPSKDPICAVLKYQSAGRMRSPAHSPKAMTREAIWQKPKNSPENITLWLEWTSREWGDPSLLSRQNNQFSGKQCNCWPLMIKPNWNSLVSKGNGWLPQNPNNQAVCTSLFIALSWVVPVTCPSFTALAYLLWLNP